MNNYLLKVSVCLIAFYICFHILFRNDKFYRRNRFFLLFSSLMSLIIPLVKFSSSLALIPAGERLSVWNKISAPITEPGHTPVMFLPTDPVFYLSIGYISVVVILTGIMLYDVRKLVVFIQKSQVVRHKNYCLVPTHGKLPTFSFFRYIFWDDILVLSNAETDMLLQHELAHVRGRHSYDLLWIELLQIVFWFNPVIYLYKKSLQEQHEFIADQAVITTTSPKFYHQLLVRHLFGKLDIHLTHGLHQIHLKKRIAMMNQVTSKKVALIKMLFIIPVMSILLLVFGLEGKGQASFHDLNLININTLYLNCGNEVTLDLPVSDDNVKITCQIDGGELIKERGHLIIIPRKNEVHLEVFRDGNKIKSYDFAVRRIPPPDIQVFHGETPIDVHKGISSSPATKLFIGVIPDPTFVRYVPKDARYRIADYQLKLVRGGNTILSKKVEGNEVMIENELQPEDEIVIDVHRIQRMNFLEQIESVNTVESTHISIPVY